MKRLSIVLLSACSLLPLFGCSSTTDEANERAGETAEARGNAHLTRVDNPEEGSKFIHATVIRSTNQTYMPTKGVVCISYEGEEAPNVRSGIEVEVAHPGKENFKVTLKRVDPDPGCGEHHDPGVACYVWNDVD